MFNLFSKNFVAVLNLDIHSKKRQNSNDLKRNPSNHKIAKLQGRNSQNFFRKFLIFFLKQISLKGDFNYCINPKLPIFYE